MWCYAHLASKKSYLLQLFSLQAYIEVSSHQYNIEEFTFKKTWSRVYMQVAYVTFKAKCVVDIERTNLSKCHEWHKQTAYTSLIFHNLEYAPVAPIITKRAISRKASEFSLVKKIYNRSWSIVTSIQKKWTWFHLNKYTHKIRMTLLFKISYNFVDIPNDDFLKPACLRTYFSHWNVEHVWIPATVYPVCGDLIAVFDRNTLNNKLLEQSKWTNSECYLHTKLQESPKSW